MWKVGMVWYGMEGWYGMWRVGMYGVGINMYGVGINITCKAQ